MASSHCQKKPTARRETSDENFAGVYRRDTFRVVDAVQEYKREWGDTIDNNLRVGKMAVKLQRHIKKAEYDDFGFPCQYSWFRKMVKIGKHPHINDPEYHDILPDARRTLYQISLLGVNAITGRDLFLGAYEDGIIHRHVTAKEVEQYRKRNTGCRSNFRMHLTVTEARSLDDTLKGTEPAPDLEMAYEITAKYREAMKQVGFSVRTNEITSDRKSEHTQTTMKAKTRRTQAEALDWFVLRPSNNTYPMERSASGDDRWEMPEAQRKNVPWPIKENAITTTSKSVSSPGQ